MTRPNTPGYVPTGAAIPLAWDPDDHLWKPVPGMTLFSPETAAAEPQLTMQKAVNAIGAATTVATLREAMLDLAEALTGLVPSVEPTT